MSLVAAITWTTFGSLVGALALYGVGAALGRDRVLALADRMPLVNAADVQKAEAWFARHGAEAGLLGRMVPLVRSLVSVPAGVQRMRLPLSPRSPRPGACCGTGDPALPGQPRLNGDPALALVEDEQRAHPRPVEPQRRGGADVGLRPVAR